MRRGDGGRPAQLPIGGELEATTKKSKILANLDSVAARAEFSSVVVGAGARPVARAAGPLVGPTHRSLAKLGGAEAKLTDQSVSQSHLTGFNRQQTSLFID